MPSITKREELPNLLFRCYRPIPKDVTAIQISGAEDSPRLNIDEQIPHGKTGDWKIFYGNNSDGRPMTAICDRDIFKKIYEHVEGDTYRKKSSLFIEAAQLEESLDIMTLEGPSHGEPGDWLLLGIEGEPYFNDDVYFKSRYILADEEVS
jgi:hypothetical protein